MRCASATLWSSNTGANDNDTRHQCTSASADEKSVFCLDPDQCALPKISSITERTTTITAECTPRVHGCVRGLLERSREIASVANAMPLSRYKE